MKDYRNELFEIIYDKISSKKKSLFLYFIDNYRYIKGELKIKNRPLIYVDSDLEKVFNSINRQTILSNLNPQYRVGWENSYDKVKKEILIGRKLLRLNQVTTAIFGPHFRPEKSAQSYNVYIKLYFNLQEIETIVDMKKLSTFDSIKIDNYIFYTIDAVAKSLQKKEKNDKKNEDFTNLTKKYTEVNEKDEIDDFSRIKNIQLSNFLNLNDININFSPGINLIIGENNIGKTGLIKLLYANAKAYEEYGKIKGTSKERKFYELLSRKLQNTFQSDDKIGTIVSKSSENELNSKITFDIANTEQNYINISFKKATRTEIPNVNFSEIYSENTLSKYNTVFIPAKEILSIADAIRVTQRFSPDGFDATYEDLLEDIKPLFAKKNDNDILEQIAKKFEKTIIYGEIEYDKAKSKYYYRDQKGFKFDLTMVAEGIKQLGIIPLLIKTGKISDGTILFLDEPDNNLNPVAITKLVSVLFELASAGVQIFITTHNHLFSQHISLFNEYKETFENSNFPKSKFFALYKDNNGKTSIETGDDLLDLSNNLILDEYVKLHDREEELNFKMKNK